jgi:hypothetical protein
MGELTGLRAGDEVGVVAGEGVFRPTIAGVKGVD